VANYGHTQSSNAKAVGTGSSAATSDEQAAAAARVRAHEDLFELGVFVDPTRATRIAASASLYNDVYADHTAAKNYCVIASGWLFF
jgi:hypothetical protein